MNNYIYKDRDKLIINRSYNQFVMDYGDEPEHNYWRSCPAEILLVVFEYLDGKDLLACMGVNTTWRATADFVGENCGKWLQLIENHVENKALNFLQRTKLKHRELYINCRMWYSVQSAQVTLCHVYGEKAIQNIHVFRDNLIITCEDTVKIFQLETGCLIKEVLEPCFDYQETDFLVAKFTHQDGRKHISLYSKRNHETYECLGFTLCNIQHNKCHLTNWKNGVDFFECTDNNFLLRRLGRYYSSPKLLCALHMYEDDMYIYTRKGDVYHRKNGELGISRVCTLDVPIPPAQTESTTDKFMTMFHKCSVVYSVDSKEREGIKKSTDVYGEEHLALLYAGLTCAVRHDDVLLLGFEDGRVGIVLIKKLWTAEDLKPAFEFYIHEVVQTRVIEPISSLEVYEADDCHHVFVATKNNVYQVLIAHEDYMKVLY